jgi:hypothetical protein
MRRDYQVALGLTMLKAPLYTLEWTVKCDTNKEVAKYIDKTLKLIWKPNIPKILRSMEYGYSGVQFQYKLKEDNKWWVCGCKEFHPRDIRILTRSNEYQGFRVKQVVGKGDVEVFPPEAFWFAINKEFGGWYGRSYLLNIWDS